MISGLALTRQCSRQGNVRVAGKHGKDKGDTDKKTITDNRRHYLHYTHACPDSNLESGV